MNRDFIKKYYPVKCARCKMPGHDPHELFGGGFRQFSIKHDIQVFLCRRCHRWAESSKKKSSQFFCEQVGIDYNLLKYSVENHQLGICQTFIMAAGRVFKDKIIQDQAWQ